MKTVKKKKKIGFFKRIKAYKMSSTLAVIGILTLVTAAAVIVYAVPFEGKPDIASELALAIATSLLASIVCISVEAFVTYRRLRGDEFIESIEQFGINNLHFDKQDLLSDWLESCRNELWISGYRLILTHNISGEIGAAAKRGAEVKILVTPAWSDAYGLVYDSTEAVTEHYAAVFSAIRSNAKDISQCEVRFINKPLFSDTYYVDGYLATGPFMHNLNEEKGRITAVDFFTYELRRQSHLYDLIYDEYQTLWQEADSVLDWAEYAKVEQQLSKVSENERRELLKSCTKAI